MRPADWMATVVLAALAVLVAVATALSAPLPGADPTSPTARWYHGLRQPGTGAGCCDQSDCRPTTARQTPAGWEAQIPAANWIPIPPDRILHDEAHPGGAAVLCWLPGRGVLCFVPPQAGG